MKILIAGATGFIGSHLVPALLRAGHEVLAIARSSGAVAGAATVISGDLTRLREVELPSADVVIHLAQANLPFPDASEDLLAVNCTSAVTLAAHTLRCGAARMIYASSGSVYGFSSGPITEASPLLGTGYYAQTKIAAEKLLAEFRPKTAVDLLRIFSPYGEGQQPFRLIPDVVARVREGRPVSVRSNGMPSLTPIHVRDVVSVILARLESSGSLTMNVAGGGTTDIAGVAACAAGLLGREAVFEINPAPLDGGIAADSSLMTASTGVQPVGLHAGLQRYLSSL